MLGQWRLERGSYHGLEWTVRDKQATKEASSPRPQISPSWNRCPRWLQYGKLRPDELLPVRCRCHEKSPSRSQQGRHHYGRDIHRSYGPRLEPSKVTNPSMSNPVLTPMSQHIILEERCYLTYLLKWSSSLLDWRHPIIDQYLLILKLLSDKACIHYLFPSFAFPTPESEQPYHYLSPVLWFCIDYIKLILVNTIYHTYIIIYNLNTHANKK